MGVIKDIVNIIVPNALKRMEEGESSKEALYKSFVEGGLIMKRNYVVISNRHKGIGGSLLFWGCKTEEHQERSFGGYTSDFNSCERYTLEEIDNSDYKFPVYGRDINHDNFKKVEDFAIEINRLKRLGHRPMLIYYR